MVAYAAQLDQKIIPQGTVMRSARGKKVHVLRYSWKIVEGGVSGRVRVVGFYYCGASGWDPIFVEDPITCQKCLAKHIDLHF